MNGSQLAAASAVLAVDADDRADRAGLLDGDLLDLAVEALAGGGLLLVLLDPLLPQVTSPPFRAISVSPRQTWLMSSRPRLRIRALITPVSTSTCCSALVDGDRSSGAAG